jgi:transcription antitermination protein NusB
MSRRSRARAVVLQILYEDDLNPRHDWLVSDQFLQRRLRNDALLVEFARELLAGVRRQRVELDQRLTETAANWSLERMAVTDRNALRLGAFEILFGDTPPRVAINEAIELARRFGTGQSGQFVNGILDRLLREQRSSHDVRSPGVAGGSDAGPVQEEFSQRDFGATE